MKLQFLFSFLVVFVAGRFVASDTNTEECEECGKQIDNQIEQLRQQPDIPIILDIDSPHLTCNISGLTRMTRDPTKLVCPQNSTNGTTYTVTVTVDEVFVNCTFNVSTAVANNVFNFTSYVVAQFQNKCPILKYGVDATKSGFSSGGFPFFPLSIASCSNATKDLLNNPVGTVTSQVKDGSVELFLIGYIKNFTYTPTVVVQNNVSTLRGFEVGYVDPKNFKMWCEGGENQPGVKEGCTCVFSTNSEKPFVVGLLSFFLTCYPNLDAYTTGAYAKIANSLTCNV